MSHFQLMVIQFNNGLRNIFLKESVFYIIISYQIASPLGPTQQRKL